MKSIIAITIIFAALGFTDPSFADRELSDIALEENDRETQAVTRAGANYVEIGHMSLYASQDGKADIKSGSAGSVMEIKLLPDRVATYNLKGLRLFENNGGASEYDMSSLSVAPEYESKSVTAADILRKVPSVSTDNEETIGILLPPFAYFAKKF